MKRFIYALLCVSVLFTCGPAEDKQGMESRPAAVLAAERVFNGAYENLDAAVLDRLLADDFRISYGSQDSEKDKDRWLGELGQLRLLFPQLRIHTDSLTITPYAELYIVQGLRTFSWNADGEAGSYQERFTNRWRQAADNWELTTTKLDQVR